MRPLYRTLIFLTAAMLMLGALPVYAQDAPKPEPVGLAPDAPRYALHGPYWVGIQVFEEETDFHPTTVSIWYPALNPSGQTEKTDYAGPRRGYAIENALPDTAGGPYPLVIFAHGLTGMRYNSTYLAEHLASHGFVVMALDYADASTARTTSSVHYSMAMFTRPQDVSWEINYADVLTGVGGPLQGMVNTQHIAVVGHSYGGYTALMAGGAQLDLSGPTSWCVLYPKSAFYDVVVKRDFCDRAEEMADLAELEESPSELWPSWGDPRVDAVVPLAPLLLFGSESTTNVTIPTMVMVGTGDRVIFADEPLYQSYVYENLGSPIKSLVEFEGAGHFIFSDSAAFGPDSVWKMDRAHDLINHFTTAFLLDVLKGDEEAHTALLAENVAFPGITYETTMK